MTEFTVNAILILLALGVFTLRCYILRDMARESRAERRWRERTQRAEQEHVKALQKQVEENRADIVRGMDRRA